MSINIAEGYRAKAGDRHDLPPPGRRTGEGSKSVLPYLLRALKSQPHVEVQRQGVPSGVGHPDRGE